jgi:hypothetical protein
MEKVLKGEVNPVLVGLVQAILVAAYCALVGSFMYNIEGSELEPGYLGVFLILVLLVFSVATVGTLIFGLPAYLVLNNKTKEALATLTYTLLFSFIIILTIISIILLTV